MCRLILHASFSYFVQARACLLGCSQSRMQSKRNAVRAGCSQSGAQSHQGAVKVRCNQRRVQTEQDAIKAGYIESLEQLVVRESEATAS